MKIADAAAGTQVAVLERQSSTKPEWKLLKLATIKKRTVKAFWLGNVDDLRFDFEGNCLTSRHKGDRRIRVPTAGDREQDRLQRRAAQTRERDETRRSRVRSDPAYKCAKRIGWLLADQISDEDEYLALTTAIGLERLEAFENVCVAAMNQIKKK